MQPTQMICHCFSIPFYVDKNKKVIVQRKTRKTWSVFGGVDAGPQAQADICGSVPSTVGVMTLATAKLCGHLTL